MRGLRRQRTEIRTDRDVAEACHAVRELAAVARFTERDATVATTIVAELTRNVLRYAVEGECSLRLDFLDGLGIPQFIIDAFDEDGDGFVRGLDNCPEVANPGQADADLDGIGDACDVACDDGLDNDGDGAVDYPDDPGCAAREIPVEDPDCSDGVDNDGDGLTDHPADPECLTAAQFSESSTRCGLGFELALLLPALMAWRRQRSRG